MSADKISEVHESGTIPGENGSVSSQRPAGRGRPRSRTTEQAILEATAELLTERGLTEISLEDIAARGRVSKASIYRRWPTKGTLAFDAFVTKFRDSQPLPDTGALESDLLSALRSWVRTVNGTATGRTLKGLIAEVQRDPELAEAWREWFVGPVRSRHLMMADRAIARGELSPGADTALLLDLLYGPGYHRLLQGHLPLDASFVSGVVGAIMAAARSGAI